MARASYAVKLQEEEYILTFVYQLEYNRGPDIARVRDRRVKYRYIGTTR